MFIALSSWIGGIYPPRLPGTGEHHAGTLVTFLAEAGYRLRHRTAAEKQCRVELRFHDVTEVAKLF
jgi:hypothetical protein